MPTITVITGNSGKLKELQALAAGSFDFVMRNISLDEIQSMDLQEIVEDKVRRAYAIVNAPVIVEDVSAGLDHLKGLPGPFFKFFEQALGKEAFLKISTVERPRVTITCLAAYYDGTTTLLGKGVLRGTVTKPRGQNGFGFDFTVVPDSETRTMAEMTASEKNAISHRGRAFRDLLAQLSKHV